MMARAWKVYEVRLQARQLDDYMQQFRIVVSARNDAEASRKASAYQFNVPYTCEVLSVRRMESP